MKNKLIGKNIILWGALMITSAAGTPALGTTIPGSFDHDLTLGSRNNDVTALQQILFDKNYLQTSPTGYFGVLTKNALAGWQKDSGIFPASGYFGPKSRSRIMALAASADQPPAHASIVAATSQVPSNAPMAMQAALSSKNPIAGALISNGTTAAARVPVLGIDFSAGGESDATISELKFHKVGVLSDNMISGAYLVENGEVVGVYTSLARGIIDFGGLNISIPSGQMPTIWLAIDPAPGLHPGNTVSFALSSASDVTASNVSGTPLAVTGTFPLTGNNFTITSVSNPSLASLTVSPLPIGTDIAVPLMDDIAAAWNFNVTNSKVLLEGLRIYENGGSYDGENLRLFVNGHQVGTSIPNPDDGDRFYFDLRDQPGVLNNGPNIVQIYADLPGAAGDSFQMQILDPYDIYAVDSQYNTPIAGQAEPGTNVNIEAATLMVGRAH